MVAVSPPPRAWTVPRYMWVVPVVFTEYMSVTVPRAVIPGLQKEAFGERSYAVEGGTLAVQGLLAFVSCPVFGAVSDAYGRVPPMVAAAVGAVLPVAALAFGGSMQTYQVLVALSGLLRGTLVVVFAYIGDVTAQGPQRTSAIGIALGTLGLALSVGPSIGAAVAERYSTLHTFYVCIALGVVSVAYMVFLLPETRGPHPFDASKANPLKVMWVVLSGRYLRHMMLLGFLQFLAYWAFVTTAMLYLSLTFEYTAVQRGRYLGIVGMCQMLAEFFFVPTLMRLGMTEHTLLRIGLLGWIIKLVMVATTTSTFVVDLSAYVTVISCVFGPAFVSMVAAAATPTVSQGEIQGAMSSVRYLAEGIGPLLMSALFEVCRPYSGRGHLMPGPPYAVVTIFVVLSLLMTRAIPPLPHAPADPAEAPATKGDPENQRGVTAVLTDTCHTRSRSVPPAYSP